MTTALPLTLKDRLEESTLNHSVDLDLTNLGLNTLPNLFSYDWVTKLTLNKNNISIISKFNLPQKLKILISNNTRITFVTLPDSIEKVELSFNSLTKFDGSSYRNLKKLDISCNEIIVFKFPPNAEKVNMESNSTGDIDDLPNTLIKFDCSNNGMIDLPKLNSKLIKLDASSNYIENIDTLPYGIKDINFEDNEIEKICYLPQSLEKINLSNNKIAIFPYLPMNIQEVYIKDNLITKLGTIPISVTILDISDNYITTFDNKLLLRDKLYIEYSNNTSWFDDSPQDDPFVATHSNIPTSTYPTRLPTYYSGYNRYGGTNTSYNYGYTNSYGFTGTYGAYRGGVNHKMNKTNPNYISVDHKTKVI